VFQFAVIYLYLLTELYLATGVPNLYLVVFFHPELGGVGCGLLLLMAKRPRVLAQQGISST
jgi:hypothetical protein